MRPSVVLCVLLLLAGAQWGGAAKGRGRGKGKGKNLLPFGNIAEYSLVKPARQDKPGAARIVKGSHFSQSFRLGYKILLICLAEGDPRPQIKWYKNGAEVPMANNINYYEKKIADKQIWSKIEIDPATMGDQGIYSCMTNNKNGLMAKNFKVEYETNCGS